MKTRSVISAGIIGIVLLSILGITQNYNDTTHENKIKFLTDKFSKLFERTN